MDLVPELLAAARAGSALDCDSAEVAATDLRRACLTEGIDPHGLRLARARITGPLDLRAATVRVPLWFDGCEFTDPLAIEGATLHELVVTDSVLPGLLGDGVRIAHDLILSGTTIRADLHARGSQFRTAAVWLADADIGGRLLAAGTRIIATRDLSLSCNRARIRGEVRLVHGFTAVRTVRFLAAQLDGYLDLSGATLSGDRNALDLNEATIAGSVFVVDAIHTGQRASIDGRIELGRATIGGQLLVRNADLHASEPDPSPETSFSEHIGSRAALLAPHLVLHGRCAIQGETVIDGGLILPGADLRSGVDFDEVRIRNPGKVGVDLSNATLNAGLNLASASIEGSVNLISARVAGVVRLTGTDLTEPHRRKSVRAVGLHADSDVDLSGVSATGGLEFRGATIGGRINAEDATILNPGSETLSLQQAHVQGNVRVCGRFRSVGALVLVRATVGGRLRADGGTFTWRSETSADEERPRPIGLAVNAAAASFLGGMDLGWTVPAGGIDLRHATTTYLADRPGSDWPVDTWLDGFTYERFVHAADAPSRIAWLSGLRPSDPRAWEQVARVLRTGGDHTGADEVLVAQRRHARHHPAVPLSLLRRAIDALQDRTVRYGFRPERVVGLLLTLIAAVTVSLSIPGWAATMRASDQNAVIYAPADGCGDGKVRCLSPFFYAVDTVVPIIDLKQRDTWYPGRGPGGTAMEWWLNICTVLGWVASTIFALSFTRLGRSSP